MGWMARAVVGMGNAPGRAHRPHNHRIARAVEQRKRGDGTLEWVPGARAAVVRKAEEGNAFEQSFMPRKITR